MIPSKPTTHDGHNFRSRTEARWAMYFRSIGVRYDYEQEAGAAAKAKRQELGFLGECDE